MIDWIVPYFIGGLVIGGFFGSLATIVVFAARDAAKPEGEPEVRTFVEVRGMRMPIGDFDPDERHMQARSQ